MITNKGQEVLTEQENPLSRNLDVMSTEELVSLFVQEDKYPQQAVQRAMPRISEAIEAIAGRVHKGGKLFYLGAGTSGRLGVLDASECPPTFSTPSELVQGVIAGGDDALRTSAEGSEDNTKASVLDLQSRSFSSLDVLIGISACGTTPYVLGGLNYGHQIGALTVSISCVPPDEIVIPCDIDIRLLTGPELLTGSTRLKAGTATKMTLNIISTVLMINLGKVYGNRMIDVSATNRKLKDRAIRIIRDLTYLGFDHAKKILDQSKGSVKIALLRHAAGLNQSEAEIILKENNNNLRSSLDKLKVSLPKAP
ncbi:N-acetylmuramic acid 6-phosphate etherase [Prochlorococcus sp. MIT 1300]|uniref:N-acetylmuramic acid 6-phosphate etherase n=1 Tax=Prochlorococcus sp. MIT 1300 TaxID=3096218 RepID=UPI002A751A71|nr:N-acetylmuramic acid 6-phosphate etherase [Prochlorococcus sp. MIT 1300]